MYGKIFESIYDGTLVDDWRALITFQQMIILCTPDGIVDMTPRAISKRTGIPIEHIEAGLKILVEPDPYSRTPGEGGRRLVKLDGHRNWGWQIVNHEKYRNIRTAQDRKEYMREYMKEYRKTKENQQSSKQDELTKVNSKQSKQDVSLLAHTDTYSDTDTNTVINISVDQRSPLMVFVLNDKTEYPIHEDLFLKWQELYPAADIMQELRGMKGWFIGNPKKAKTRAGILRFINSWLSTAQNRGGNGQVNHAPKPSAHEQRLSKLDEWERKQGGRIIDGQALESHD